MGGIMLALPRWTRDPYYRTIFRGRVLDCGGSGDPFAAVAGRWPHVTEVVTADSDPAPGTYIQCDLNTWTPEPESFDLVLSSHTLEHLRDPWGAADRWWSAVTPGGHMLLIVPDYRTYERENWPSGRNPDHKSAWTLLPTVPVGDRGPLALLDVAPWSRLHRAQTLDADFDPADPTDQTGTGMCECGLEAVWWKRP